MKIRFWSIIQIGNYSKKLNTITLNKLNYLIKYKENKNYEINLYYIYSYLLDEKTNKKLNYDAKINQMKEHIELIYKKFKWK
jgi:hypothetical protein